MLPATNESRVEVGGRKDFPAQSRKHHQCRTIAQGAGYFAGTPTRTGAKERLGGVFRSLNELESGHVG